MLLKKTLQYQFFMKVNGIEGKIPRTTGLVNKSQYGADKKILKKILKMLIEKNAKYCWFS